MDQNGKNLKVTIVLFFFFSPEGVKIHVCHYHNESAIIMGKKQVECVISESSALRDVLYEIINETVINADKSIQFLLTRSCLYSHYIQINQDTFFFVTGKETEMFLFIFFKQ